MVQSYNQDVLTLAGSYARWGLQTRLNRLDRKARVKYLEEAARDACSIEKQSKYAPEPKQVEQADEDACNTVLLLFQACDDVHFLPLVSHTNQFGRWLDEKKWDEQRKAEVTAKADKADAAMRIYGAMLDKENNPGFNWAQGDTRKGAVPYHSKTRSVLLSEIACEWCEASDKRGMEFFKFLVQAASVPDSDYRKMVLKVVREFNRKCRQDRLEKSILSLDVTSEHTHGLNEALLLGWDVSRELVLLNHTLRGSGSAMWNFLQQAAEKSVAFGLEVAPLFAEKVVVMNPPGWTEAGPLSGWKMTEVDPAAHKVTAVRTYKYDYRTTDKDITRDLHETRINVLAWKKEKGLHPSIYLKTEKMDYTGKEVESTQTETC